MIKQNSVLIVYMPNTVFSGPYSYLCGKIWVRQNLYTKTLLKALQVKFAVRKFRKILKMGKTFSVFLFPL